MRKYAVPHVDRRRIGRERLDGPWPRADRPSGGPDAQIFDPDAGRRRFARQGRDPPRHAEVLRRLPGSRPPPRSSTTTSTSSARCRPTCWPSRREPGRQPQRHPDPGPGQHDRARSGSSWWTPAPSTSPPTTTRLYTWFWIDLPRGPWSSRCRRRCSARQRHVVSLGRRCRHHRAGQGRGRQVPAAAAGLQGRGASRLPRRASADLQQLWIWRSFLVDGDPKPGVDAVKKHTKIYPLAEPQVRPR